GMPPPLVAHCKRDMTPCTLSAWLPKAIGFRHRLRIIEVDSSLQLLRRAWPRRTKAVGIGERAFKRQSFCRMLRQTVQRIRAPSPNRKNTNDNSIARFAKWCVHKEAECGATCENQHSGGSVRHPIHSRRQAAR